MNPQQKLLGYGLMTGALFGLFLQKAKVLRYEKQVGALRLVDLSIVKFMLSSLAVGMTAFHLLKDRNQVDFNIGDTKLPANILGGLTFGAGWGLIGYCPGTSVGAVGEGRWDALLGILGLLTGAGIYAEAYPKLKTNILQWMNLGRFTIPSALKTNHWTIIPAFVAFTFAIFGLLEKNGK